VRDKQLDMLIAMWEAELFHCAILLDPSMEVLIKKTITYLKELMSIKEKEDTL